MKTLVLFDVGGKLYSCYLDDLAVAPAPGHWWVFEGTRYEFVDSGETLGTKGIDRRNRSGNEKLLDLLNCLYKPEDVAALYAGLTSVSAKDDGSESKTAGGLITINSAAAVPKDFDHVLLVRLKKVKGSATGVRLMPLTKLTGGGELQKGLTAGGDKPAGGKPDGSPKRTRRRRTDA